MSGHSKWSKVKHQKESTDSVKGKLFTKLANAIIIAVKQGGGVTDPEGNVKLKFAVEQAKHHNMPKDKIERAIERAKGTSAEDNIIETVYEAFGPGGVGIIIETATSNKQRIVSELKNTLERSGGTLATPGAVSHFFQRTGAINVAKDHKSYDEVMEGAVNAGAEDIEDIGDTVEVYTEPATLHRVKEALLASGFHILSFDLVYRPTTTIAVDNRSTAQQLLKLLGNLEDLEDVQKVFSNFDIPDEYLHE